LQIQFLVLKKSKYEPPTTEDLNLSYKPVYLTITIILDGEIIKDNLNAIGFDENWLLDQVHMFGIQNIEDVFYADWKQDEGIHVVQRNNKN